MKKILSASCQFDKIPMKDRTDVRIGGIAYSVTFFLFSNFYNSTFFKFHILRIIVSEEVIIDRQ